MDWAEFKARREEAPATMRVPLCADGEAVRKLEEAKASRQPEVRELIPSLQEVVTEATLQIVVRALPADEYQALKDAHRPTDPDKLKRGDEWDEATFAPALIAASVHEPALSLEEATDLWHGKDPGSPTLAERATLFLACRDLNETVPDLGFTKPDTA